MTCGNTRYEIPERWLAGYVQSHSTPDSDPLAVIQEAIAVWFEQHARAEAFEDDRRGAAHLHERHDEE